MWIVYLTDPRAYHADGGDKTYTRAGQAISESSVEPKLKAGTAKKEITKERLKYWDEHTLAFIDLPANHPTIKQAQREYIGLDVDKSRLTEFNQLLSREGFI